jgi:type II secretory ATPase GspE/PulE/Tfp pilus assembly ATPase PilB-like protein
LYKGSGCADCEHTGFKGRIGIYEVLVVSAAVKEAILNREPSTIIRDIAISEGMTTMFEDGLTKAYAGDTTLAEVLRTINE